MGVFFNGTPFRVRANGKKPRYIFVGADSKTHPNPAAELKEEERTIASRSVSRVLQNQTWLWLLLR